MGLPQVRRITAAETIPLRLAILRPGLPAAAALFPRDDAESTRHLGAFNGPCLVGIASIYDAPLPEQPEKAGAWQLRGMATSPEVRGRGFGRELVLRALSETTAAGGALLWCNARIGAAAFYARLGFQIVGDEFDIPTAGPHLRMWIEL